jgi:hypothetical protein
MDRQTTDMTAALPGAISASVAGSPSQIRVNGAIQPGCHARTTQAFRHHQETSQLPGFPSSDTPEASQMAWIDIGGYEQRRS